MRTLAAWAALILFAGVGCSSSSGPKILDGEAGSFAPGAGGNGGAGGIAGTTGTGGSAGATGGGGGGTGGGTAGSGGRGGAGGSGTGGMMNTGAAGNPGDCPATAPVVGPVSCTTNTAEVCNYAGETCGCRAEGAVNGWNCISCPAFEPVNGSSCTPPSGAVVGGINCPYGNDFCACRSDNTWYCRCNGCP